MGKKVTNEKLAQMLQKEFLGINKRFDGIDKRFDGIDKRFEDLEKGLNTKMEKGFKESEMRDERIERILRAEVDRHDRHSLLLVDHEKRIKELEKV